VKVLIQRVTQASVEVNQQIVGKIDQGLLVLLGVEKHDSEDTALRMAEKLLAYRVFGDEQGKMNLSVRDIAGELLVVSQFTLVADTSKGLRPGFSGAADPLVAEQLYESLVGQLRQQGTSVATGQFAADMKVQLINDGPVTFLLEL
jgi:D-tyrosyl-tRNA(Tyr) deacylase